MNLLARITQSLVAWVLPRPRLVLGGAFLSALACLLYAGMRLDVQTDQLELISAHHPLIALNEKLEPFNFNGKTTFMAVIEAPTPDRGLTFLRALVSRIQADPDHYKEVIFRIDPNLVKRWALLFLDKKDLLQIGDRVEEHSAMIERLAGEPDLIGFLKLVNQEMAARMVGELFTGFLDEGKPPRAGSAEEEPFDLSFLIKTLEGLASYVQGVPEYVSPWSSFFKSDAWDLDREGYFWEGGKRFLIASVVPTKKGEGLNKAQDALDNLRGAIKELEAEFPGVHGGVTGQEALNYDEMDTASTDMSLATWASLLGVLVLMALFFHGFRRAFIEILALGVGLCWTFGWTTLFVGHLNILSVVFAPMLCGLGVDYGIYWYARFEEEERIVGRDRRSAIGRVVKRSGPAIMLAGLSTAFSFLPLVLTGFRGLVELGLITGVGIILILLADFTVLPALSLLMDRYRESGGANGEANGRDLLALKPRAARLVLAAVGVICLASLWSARNVRFDLNPLRLQSPEAESVIWEKILVERSHRSVLSAAVFASTPEEVRERSESLKALPSVSEVQNIFSFLPENQEEKISLLRSYLPKIPEMRPKSAEIRPGDVAELTDALERIRFKLQEDQASKWGAQKPLVDQMAQVRSLGDAIISALRSSPEAVENLALYRKRFQSDLAETMGFLRDGASASPMTIKDIPKALRDQFYRHGEYLIRIFPKGSVWEQDALSEFVHQIWSVDAQAVGDPISLYVFATAFKKACILASAYALIAISILLLLSLRSLRLVLLAMAPLLVGTIWTIGIMGITGVNLNLANSMFMPLIVGAGVEYGVIILHRWREGRMSPGRLPMSTGKGVILAALTTTVGFGTLMISHHRGIFSLGFVAWAGSICVLLTAIVILPAILADTKPPRPVDEEGELEDETEVFCDSVNDLLPVGDPAAEPGCGYGRGRHGGSQSGFGKCDGDTDAPRSPRGRP